MGDPTMTCAYGLDLGLCLWVCASGPVPTGHVTGDCTKICAYESFRVNLPRQLMKLKSIFNCKGARLSGLALRSLRQANVMRDQRQAQITNLGKQTII
eukprot:535116-Pelagomonas_calceolata.AAC.9